MVRAIVGANWGDEGKGKITDMLAKESDIIIRFQGGSNAGHTIINDYGKFALHILPSGVFYDHTTSIIGNGVALNIPYLIGELKDITSKGVPMPRILVSDRAQIMMPYHILFDTYEEARLAGRSFGSTKSGIAPFYSDKYAKIGFQVCELFGDETALMEKLENVCALKNVLLEHLYHKPLLDPKELFDTMMEYKEMIAPYVCDVSRYLHDALKEGKNILLEGQLGSLKDPDHGIIWNTIDHLLYWKEHREKHCVSRKKYMRLCILGAFGVHQFYAKRPVLGLLYLATFWSGFSAAMTIVDFIIAVPMKPDEDGNIWL